MKSKYRRIMAILILVVILLNGILPMNNNVVLAEVSVEETKRTGEFANILSKNMQVYAQNDDGTSEVVGTAHFNIDTVKEANLYVDEAGNLVDGTTGKRYSLEIYATLDGYKNGQGYVTGTYITGGTQYIPALGENQNQANSGITYNLYRNENVDMDLSSSYVVVLREIRDDGESNEVAIKVTPDNNEDPEDQKDISMGGQTEQTDVPYDDRTSVLSPIEWLIGSMLTAIANGLNAIISIIFAEKIDIDKLVFNHYAETQISFFRGTERGSSIIWGEGGINKTVSFWYSIFRKIALVVYMIILAYMGVRIMLASTGRDMERYKSLFMYWCAGVAILFFYPYVMKYAIQLNDTAVKLVENSKVTILKSNNKSLGYNPSAPELGSNTTTDSNNSFDANDDGTSDLENGESQKTTDPVTINFDVSPFNTSVKGSTNYMAVISQKANNTRSFAISLTYLILTWQLITLIVFYYKRVFTIALLITIFPLVAASFAIDRVADGKSQAFGKWNKEFILNVFIQTFHAIVYVFVCGTVSVTMGSGNNDSMDYVLIITGITFLFTGEEIMKKIFTQGESALTKSLAKTASATAVEVATVTSVTSGIGKTVARGVSPIIGKNSIGARFWNYHQRRRSDALQEKHFDENAYTNPYPYDGSGFRELSDMMKKIDNDDSMTYSQKLTAKADLRSLAQAVDTFNNPNGVSAEELSSAYSRIRRELENNQSNKLLNNMKITPAQFSALASASVVVADRIALGDDHKTIERDIKVQIGMTLEGLDDTTVQKYSDAFFTDMATRGASLGYTDEGTKTESNELRSTLAGMNNSYILKDNYTELSDVDEKKANDEKDQYIKDVKEDTRRKFEQHAREYNATKAEYTRRNLEPGANKVEIDQRNAELKAFKDELGEFDSGRDELARDLAIFSGRESGAFTAKEQLDAIEGLKKFATNNEFARETIEDAGLDLEDIDTYAHILSSKVVNIDSVSAEAKAKAADMLATYESDDIDLRDGYDDDEFSVHEAIKNLNSDEDFEEMTNRITLARRRANQESIEKTRAFAQNVLDENNIDIHEGQARDDNLYVDGMTREQLHERNEPYRIRHFISNTLESEKKRWFKDDDE